MLHTHVESLLTVFYMNHFPFSNYVLNYLCYVSIFVSMKLNKTPQLTPRGFALLQIQLNKRSYPFTNTRLNSFCTGGMAATTTHSSVSTPIEKKL